MTEIDYEELKMEYETLKAELNRKKKVLKVYLPTTISGWHTGHLFEILGYLTLTVTVPPPPPHPPL